MRGVNKVKLDWDKQSDFTFRQFRGFVARKLKALQLQIHDLSESKLIKLYKQADEAFVRWANSYKSDLPFAADYLCGLEESIFTLWSSMLSNPALLQRKRYSRCCAFVENLYRGLSWHARKFKRADDDFCWTLLKKLSLCKANLQCFDSLERKITRVGLLEQSTLVNGEQRYFLEIKAVYTELAEVRSGMAKILAQRGMRAITVESIQQVSQLANQLANLTRAAMRSADDQILLRAYESVMVVSSMLFEAVSELLRMHPLRLI